MKIIKKFKARLTEKGFSQQEITHRTIKFLLMMEGLEQLDIARKLNVSLQAVNYVVVGDRKTLWVRDAIAEILDVDYEELWGEPHPEERGAA